MKRASFPLRLAAIGAVVLAAGCYRYVPVEMSGVQPGSEVRARLTPAGQEEMTRLFGPDVRLLDGELVRWNGDEIAVLKEMTLQVEGFPATRAVDTLRLSAAQFSGVELKELDGKRTLWFTAGVVGSMAGAVIAAKHFGGFWEDPGEEGGDGDDTEADILLPALIFSIPFQIFR